MACGYRHLGVGVMKCGTFAVGALLLLVASGCGGSSSATSSGTPAPGETTSGKTESFTFHYDGTINGLSPGKTARVWLPVAQSSHDQEVEVLPDGVQVPGDYAMHNEKRFGNKLIYFEAAANDQGEIPVRVAYRVRRKELAAETGEMVKESELEGFLQPSSLVPVGDDLLSRVVGSKRPEGETKQVAGELYDAVYKWMDYGKPEDKAWGRGDATYACDARVGNCTDFHSLFISMCRTLKMPAKFEIGFMLPPEGKEGTVGGYHCWAKFADSGRWVAVDISEADKDASLKDYYFGSLTANRVTFTTGRDLKLVPAPAKESVNFLVYPYVEVDGQSHKGFTKEFRFERAK